MSAIDPPLLEPVHTLFATSSSRCASSWALEMLLFGPTARSSRSCKARLTGLVLSPRGVSGPGVFSAVDIVLSARGVVEAGVSIGGRGVGCGRSAGAAFGHHGVCR